MLIDKLGDVVARDAKVNEQLYNILLERLETAKITQSLEASKEGTRYTILDPARLPLKPIKPNKIIILMMGLFLGVCAGVSSVFISEMLDHSFLDVEGAKAALGIPVLGAISKIVTQADIRAQKMRNIQITGISLMMTVLLVMAIIFNVILR